MKKSSKENLQLGAIIGGILGLIINGSQQLDNKNPQQKFDYQSFVLAGTIGAIIGLTSASVLNLIMSIFSTRKEIIDEADEISYLVSAIGSYTPDEIDKEVLIKGRKVKSALKNKFAKDILGNVSYQGSVKQGTAISGLSDLDIRIQFKKTSFPSESKMYNTVYNFFKYHFKDSELKDVRKQKVSIGLIYKIDEHEEIIDVVPALRTDFVRGKNDYTLFKNPELCEGSWKLKMNPKKQEEFGTFQKDKIDIIKLLKLLKTEVQLPIKSILLKEFTKKAFEKNSFIPNGLNERLLMTLEFIRDNIETINIKAPDNVRISLTDNLTSKERKSIKVKIDRVICDLLDDRRNFTEYFPERV
ncbi:hypothetical protein [Lacinutrix sp. MedPE-SW]|uniref:hypothetical protein n=1 Tax=Lacinutrix sp. MedPE-SW TaxID=1860087 RepID=UPI0009135807|nr:hypothetical protein [Lacinutrix sp. MedPE-SW]OIQ21199.1 MAG: hypothetical protein BM549_09495 [Lacinutrix sp. MedPE-SW]